MKKNMDAYRSEIISLPKFYKKPNCLSQTFLGLNQNKIQLKYLPVNVIFSIGWQIIIDDQGDLLDINTASQQIGGNKDTGRTRSELTHNDIALFLVHVTMLK